METVVPDGQWLTSRITRRQWLTSDVFILGLERPPDFKFMAGQRIRLRIAEEDRDYSLIPGDRQGELELLIRSVSTGLVSSHLSRCPMKTPLAFSGPGGQFIYRPSSRQAVFAATGTGIAPFAAMCRSGIGRFILLHGVRDADNLHYRALLESAAMRFVPCLTDPAVSAPPSGAFEGRLTQYLRMRLGAGEYDFYLAGRREMIADAMAIIDDRFPTSRVYTEIFF
jgi:NAD(P)H-flavin reductase